MGHLEESWNEVGDQFKKLGARLKQHYEDQGSGEGVEEFEESLDESMQRLGEGLQAAVAAVGDSVDDPELKADVRDAAGSLFSALGATFSDLGTRIAAPHGEVPDDVAPVEHHSDDEVDPPADTEEADAAADEDAAL